MNNSPCSKCRGRGYILYATNPFAFTKCTDCSPKDRAERFVRELWEDKANREWFEDQMKIGDMFKDSGEA